MVLAALTPAGDPVDSSDVGGMCAMCGRGRAEAVEYFSSVIVNKIL